MLDDANGNVTNLNNAGAVQGLLWSSRNQLTNVVAAVSAAFQYDGLGRRVARTISAVQTKYLYDGLDAILEKDAGGLPLARYLRGLAIDEPWQRSDVALQGATGPTNGLRGWWKMNEGTGTLTADSSGNGNTGTLTGIPTWTTGVASNALNFDGVNDYVDVGDKATLEGNATWTFAGWINPSSFPAGRDTYLYYKDKVLLWGFLSATNRRLSVNIGSGSGGNPWQGASTSAMDMNSNVWTHVAVTYTNSQVKFYVNGLLTETVSKTYTMGNNNQAFSISTATQAYPGKLDDVRYYNRALNDAEMVQVYGEQATNRIYLADALGSIVALTDTSKAIQTEYDYQPFGATTTTGQFNKNSYRFTGREDDGTGMYYYRARYYHPGLGRFVSEDPLREIAGLNFYTYTLNDPILYADALGLMAWYDIWLNDASDFSAGLGSNLSFGLTDIVNDWTGASSAVNNCSGWYTAGTWSGIALSTAIGANGLPAGLRGLSNGAKGAIGEGLSMVENTLKGSRNLASQTRSIPGFRTIVDSTWRSAGGQIYYVEAKFGTSGLTAAQRAAANALGDQYVVERWGYDFFGRVGGYLGFGFGAGGAASGRGCGCN